MRTIFSILEKKIAAIYSSFFGKWNTYYRGRYNGLNSACPNYVFFKDWKCSLYYLKILFLGRRWINDQRKSNSVRYNTLHWNKKWSLIVVEDYQKSIDCSQSLIFREIVDAEIFSAPSPLRYKPHRHYPRACYTLPGFARIKRPRWRPSNSTIGIYDLTEK